MSTVKSPYPLPAEMSPNLLRVRSYWESLKRAGNEMPFWDDLKLSALPDLTDSLLLMDVFADPERFRFNTIGKAFAAADGQSLTGKFADEVALRGPFEYLRSQCSAAVEGGIPTFYRHDGSREAPAFSRLFLPMWGDGHISMLLGALDRR
jgi:hypothetical protein